MKNIKIIGCGWLGFPLASHFVSKGYQVDGTSTSEGKLEKLRTAGINPYLVQLPEESDLSFLQDEGIVIINIPPQTRSKGPDHHLKSIQALASHLQNNHKVIYVSATSVYKEGGTAISEKAALDRESDRAKALWQVENLLKEKIGDQLCILRCGGLLGYDRIPGSYSSGKEVDSGNDKVNYIHRDDAIGIIDALIQQAPWGETFNVVAPKHPLKRTVYLSNAEKYNFDPPIFMEVNRQENPRYIDSRKVAEYLDYSFKYPDPVDFYYTK